MPKTFIFLPFLCLFFTSLTMKTNCTPISAYCTTSMCGDTEIRYPFWLQNTTAATVQETYCGYPGLGIVCTSSNTSILISVSKQYFLVKSIDYANYTATLNASGFGRGMKDEFLLVWGASMECSKCEMSYGRCGYDNTSELIFLCFCEDGTITNDDCKGGRKDHHLKKLRIEIVVPIVTVLTCSLIILYCVYMKHSKAQPQPPRISNDDEKLEVVIKQCGSNIPTRYTYSDITKMTNSFNEKIGQGGHGDVYKGYLFDGHPMAVKLLKNNKFRGDQFLSEIASISTTSHVNIVSLLGFCFDGGNKCALIYEYMPNGSLEKHIRYQESNSLLGIDQRYNIAIGIARGLHYLHSKHNSMVHFDIKPQNILLDEDYCPKISDFGMAIFCNKRETILSKLQARGTIGYIAPELFNASIGIVSLSTDVYSFGMMVLEMVGARNNPATTMTTTGNNSEAYFPDWVYKRVTRHTNQDLENNDINAIERKMILVGLWCIQINPLHRPTIKKVIEMLEGSIEGIEVPPKPEFHGLPACVRASLMATTSVSNTVLSSSSRSAGDSSQEDKIVDGATSYNSGSYSCDLTLPR